MEKNEQDVPEKKEKSKLKPKGPKLDGQAFGKPSKRVITPRRDRADSAHDLPSGLDNVGVTVDEIMDKYYGKLHHEIINLGLKLVSEKYNGASIRCLAILRAMIKFIKDYDVGKFP